MASPEGAEGIYYEKEQDLMPDAFKSFDREEVYLDMPDPVKSTLTEIQEHLADGRHDILHITAHGGMNDEGEGLLYLEDHRGNLQEVKGDELMKVLVPPPRLVILPACHSARQEPGLMPAARALFEAGITAVIGMKTKISHLAAIDFNVAFFQALAAGKPLSDVFTAGKAAIFKGEQQRLREIPGWDTLKEDEIPQLLVREKDENLTREDFSGHCIKAPDRPQGIFCLAPLSVELHM